MKKKLKLSRESISNLDEKHWSKLLTNGLMDDTLSQGQTSPVVNSFLTITSHHK